ncbi:biopolymer transporter ExbD [Spirosoma aureum]|uniref:Biopolymer transporter ExbD n=1 Tax=Spirosoma aureum TaxID=2692134 RepID=A0A6G9AKE6_9BACT|nr:biopolymer transporter ExbD [Spirosoma aureum]QIP12941.1 biopolymer transporter ExbD [Spirosoma aureum]
MRNRRNRSLPRIDMTPFVSIALLLIVFFVWVKAVQQPTVVSGWDVPGCRKGIIPERSKWVLEIILVDRDTIQFCHFPGGSVCRANFVTAHRHSTKLREALFRHRKEALTPGELAIVVRPCPESTVGNFVDVLDEFRIAGNLPYLLRY